MECVESDSVLVLYVVLVPLFAILQFLLITSSVNLE